MKTHMKFISPENKKYNADEQKLHLDKKKQWDLKTEITESQYDPFQVKKRQIHTRMNDYQKRQFNQVLTPKRVDPFSVHSLREMEKTPEKTSFSTEKKRRNYKDILKEY